MTKITPEHLARGAFVYVRQSTADQLLHNHESRRRQYGLADRARQLGWQEIVVIDDDLGRSGSGVSRPGFERLLAAICEGRAGAVFAIEVGDRLGIVWIGYDDNRAARLSGAAAALPVWGEMMAMLDPEPLALAKPDGVETVLIDPESGLRADAGCAGAIELPFARGSAPAERAPCSSALGVVVEEVLQQTKSWWERLFGN